MTKAEKKAALKAAKVAAKKEKKEAQNAGGKEKLQEKVETVETTTEVSNNKKTDLPKEDEKSKKKPKKEYTPTFIPEEVNENIVLEGNKSALKRASNLIAGASKQIPIGSDDSSLNGKSMLAYVMWEKYGKNKTLADTYPELYTDLMNSIDVVVLLGLVDIRQELLSKNEKGELNIVGSPEQILRLQTMSEMLGIKLAPVKALPISENNTTQQMSIDFAKSEVPEELKQKDREEEVPELDPEKIDEAGMIKALKYLSTKEKNVATNIVNIVEWYRKYRITKATNAEDKLKFDDFTVADWLNEIFSIIPTTAILNGLGRSVYLYTSQTGSPCMAHALLHTHMSKAGWSEEQIASVLKALVNENFRYKLKDDDKLKASDDKALNTLLGTLGNDYIESLLNDYEIDLKSVEASKKNEMEDRRKKACMVVSTIRRNYFDEATVPTKDDLRMAIGRIINIYRDPADRLAEYCQDTITTSKEGEYPEKKS